MNRDEILEKSRKDHRNRDPMELSVLVRAGDIAQGVAACICLLIVLLSALITDTFLYSPWVIYFSIHGTYSLVKFVHLRRKSELVLSLAYFSLCALSFVLLIARLLEYRS